jgi:hypothetical protein
MLHEAEYGYGLVPIGTAIPTNLNWFAVIREDTATTIAELKDYGNSAFNLTTPPLVIPALVAWNHRSTCSHSDSEQHPEPL